MSIHKWMFPLLLLLLPGCEQAGPPLTASPLPVVTMAPLPTVPPAPESAGTATQTSTASPATAVPAPETPLPPTPAPGLLGPLEPPLLVSGNTGRLYARATVDGRMTTVVLSAEDGRLLGTYDAAGSLGYNAGDLLVDTGEQLIAYDAGSGRRRFAAPLPAVDPAGELPPAPQIDPESGRVFAFRDRTVHVFDRKSGEILRSESLELELSVCSEPAGFAPIKVARYDLISRTLYLDFVTYVCTPWFSHTIVAFGVDLQEQGRFLAGRLYQAVPFAGNLHGTTSPRLGPMQQWAWNGRADEPWFRGQTEAAQRLQGIIADWGRGEIVEALGGRLYVWDAGTRDLLQTLPLSGDLFSGQLVGHDPVLDHFFFLTDKNELVIRPGP